MGAPVMIRLLLGVDAGKSKTVCLLADRSGSMVGWARSGNADESVVSLGVALDAVVAAVEAASRTAQAHADDREVGCFGMAGADWPEDFEQLHDELSQRRLARVVIVRNDAQTLRGASASGAGIVLSAGAHLSVALRTTAGQEWFSGWSSVDGPGGARSSPRDVGRAACLRRAGRHRADRSGIRCDRPDTSGPAACHLDGDRR